MKRIIVPILISLTLWAGIYYNFARAADHKYVGVHVTVPFSFDGYGIQIVGRNENFEARAGYDSRHEYQLGGGVTTGTEGVLSGGAAYSSHAGRVVPYAAGSYGTGDWEGGAVTYGLDSYTSYVFAGYKFWRDGNNNGGGDQPAANSGKVNPPDDKVIDKKPVNPNDGKDNDPTDGNAGGGNDGGSDSGSGDSGGGSGGNDDSSNGGGGSGSDDGGSGGNDDSGSGDAGTGGGSQSGLGDGTNPGRGGGRDHSPNTGTDNPNRAQR
jgi:hypothetical protein